jgi:PAS domain S-box-containing protein
MAFKENDFHTVGRFVLTRDNSHPKKEAETILQKVKRYSRLYRSTLRQLKKKELLDRVRNAIARELNIRTITRIATEGIAESFGYPLVSLYILQGDTLILQNQVGQVNIAEKILTSQCMEWKVVRSGKSILLKDAKSIPVSPGTTQPISSKIYIPLFDQPKVVGLLIVETTKNMRLSEADLHLLEAIGENISNALWRARIYAESLQTQEALDKERRLLRTVIDNIPDQIFARDRDCSFTLSNLKDAQRMGVTDPDQILGKNDLDFFPPELAIRYIADDKWVMESGQPLINIVEPMVDSDGNNMWIMTTKVPLRDNQDQIIGLVGIARDITKERQVAHALEEAKHQAEEANNAKSKFLANMSHEIRTPLNAILGFSQLLLREPGLTPVQRHQLTTINKSGEHLLGLINDILEISKIEAGRAIVNITTFDLYAMVQDLKTLFQVQMDEKHLSFDVIIEDRVPHFIISDESKLRQILINLIGNAVKFTKQGKIHCIVDAQHIGDKNWRLIEQIEETGIGITADDIQKLFQVFQQVPGKSSEGGTGLGLAISQRFAKMLNGQIQVSSEPGVGSCFTLETIVQEDKNIQPEKKYSRLKISGIKNPVRTYRVLVVDDVKESRELLSSFLTQAGFELQEASNGKEALQVWESWSPHLIIMDIRMPIMSGMEAATHIRGAETDSHVPIIAATASAFEEERQTILETGINGYLRKPIQEHELFELVSECLGIEYSYYPDNDQELQKPASTSFPADEFKSLPADLREQMISTCSSADLDGLLDVMEQIRTNWPQAFCQIEELAQKLQYDDILSLLQGRS